MLRKRWLHWTLIAASAMVIAAVAFDELYVVDLRPSALRLDELPPDRETEGRLLLEEAAEAHGLKAWEEHEILDLTFVDEWNGELMQRFYMEWGHSPQKIQAQFLRGAWTSRFLFLDGPDEGHVWGIQSWKTYKTAPEGEAMFESDPGLEFTLPTVQYFFELPFRVRSGSVIADAGPAEWEGKTYDRVFVTWDTLTPTRNLDQYIVWIDEETKLIMRTDYTVRDQGAFVSGTAQFGDFRDVGGVQFPYRVSLYAVVPGGLKALVHEMKVEEAVWDKTDLALLRPDPDLPEEGDAKPPPSQQAETETGTETGTETETETEKVD